MKLLVIRAALLGIILTSLPPVLAGKKLTNTTLKRGKRYLDYLQKSRMFFRANVKCNIIKVNQLWANAYGFRANYPIENDKEHRPFKRDVYGAIEDLMDHHGFDGRACVLKSFCEASRTLASESGMLFKLFKLIFTMDAEDQDVGNFSAFHGRKVPIFGEGSFKQRTASLPDYKIVLVGWLEAEDRRHFPYLKEEYCEQIFHNHCPVSFDSISPFTDDI